MFIKVLGSAAGGGAPQWNCACSNCRSIRERSSPANFRLQCQLAISSDGDLWHLLNASPDLRLQIESNPALHPRAESSTRNSPIQSVVLTNGDLDHTLGLLLMREWHSLKIYVTEPVRHELIEGNTFFSMLHRTEDQTNWQRIQPRETFELVAHPSGSSTGLFCTPIELSDRYPSYVPNGRSIEYPLVYPRQAVIGLVLEDHNAFEKGTSSVRSRKLGFFPGLESLTPDLLELFNTCDQLFVDGTFWDESELIRVLGHGRTASQMGHIPISGEKGTLAQLRSVTRPQKFFIHINNTNPILDESSEAYRQVREAGWGIAREGQEFEL